MKTSISIFTLLTICSPTMAHTGPRFWIGNVDGRITTYTSDDDHNPTVYTPCRIFGTELTNLAGIYTVQFPGYEVRKDGGNVSPGTTFGFNLTGSALYFDEITETFVTVEEMFGPPEPGPVPQIAISQGANIRSTNGGPVNGFNFFTFNSIGDHSHLSYTLLGDGVTASDGPSGVYAISLELTSTSLTTSDIYWLLIGKDVAQNDPLFQLAVEVAQDAFLGADVAGDIDDDSDVDEDDVAAFIAVLLDAPFNSEHINRCDLNEDSAEDGRDVQPFVEAYQGL